MLIVDPFRALRAVRIAEAREVCAPLFEAARVRGLRDEQILGCISPGLLEKLEPLRVQGHADEGVVVLIAVAQESLRTGRATVMTAGLLLCAALVWFDNPGMIPDRTPVAPRGTPPQEG